MVGGLRNRTVPRRRSHRLSADAAAALGPIRAIHLAIYGSGGRIRTSNQGINSPLRYRCATPEEGSMVTETTDDAAR